MAATQTETAGECKHSLAPQQKEDAKEKVQ
jgi:hypothetical protein